MAATSPSRLPCVTSRASALFVDLPANVAGSWVIGLLSAGDALATALPWQAQAAKGLHVAALPQASALQGYPQLWLGLRTGFCGSLTTFASWMLQVGLAGWPGKGVEGVGGRGLRAGKGRAGGHAATTNSHDQWPQPRPPQQPRQHRPYVPRTVPQMVVMLVGGAPSPTGTTQWVASLCGCVLGSACALTALVAGQHTALTACHWFQARAAAARASAAGELRASVSLEKRSAELEAGEPAPELDLVRADAEAAAAGAAEGSAGVVGDEEAGAATAAAANGSAAPDAARAGAGGGGASSAPVQVPTLSVQVAATPNAAAGAKAGPGAGRQAGSIAGDGSWAERPVSHWCADAAALATLCLLTTLSLVYGVRDTAGSTLTHAQQPRNFIWFSVLFAPFGWVVGGWLVVGWCACFVWVVFGVCGQCKRARSRPTCLPMCPALRCGAGLSRQPFCAVIAPLLWPALKRMHTAHVLHPIVLHVCRRCWARWRLAVFNGTVTAWDLGWLPAGTLAANLLACVLDFVCQVGLAQVYVSLLACAPRGTPYGSEGGWAPRRGVACCWRPSHSHANDSEGRSCPLPAPLASCRRCPCGWTRCHSCSGQCSLPPSLALAAASAPCPPGSWRWVSCPIVSVSGAWRGAFCLAHGPWSCGRGCPKLLHSLFR